MTLERCPKCGKTSLRIVNVMGSTRMIHYACRECCHKEKRPYPEDVPKSRQMTLTQTRLGV